MAWHEQAHDYRVQLHSQFDELRVCALSEISRLEELVEVVKQLGNKHGELFDPDEETILGSKVCGALDAEVKDFRRQFHRMLEEIRDCTFDEVGRLEQLAKAQPKTENRVSHLVGPPVQVQFANVADTLTGVDEGLRQHDEEQHLLVPKELALSGSACRGSGKGVDTIEQENRSCECSSLRKQASLSVETTNAVQITDAEGAQRIAELEARVDEILERTVEAELGALNDLKALRQACDAKSSLVPIGEAPVHILHTSLELDGMQLRIPGDVSNASLGSICSNTSRCLSEEAMELTRSPQGIQGRAKSKMISCTAKVAFEPRPPCISASDSKSLPNKTKRGLLQTPRPVRRAQGAGMPLPARSPVKLRLDCEDLATSMERLRVALESQENGGLAIAFRKINASRTGKITCTEITTGLGRMGVSSHMASDIFRRLVHLAKCEGRQGYLTLEEWLIAFAKVGTATRMEAAVNAVAKLQVQSSAQNFVPTRRDGVSKKPDFGCTM